MHLKHQQRRVHLTGYLKDLSDKNIQFAEWIPDNPGNTISTFDWVVHFFFDDTQLSSAPKNEIGFILVSNEEAISVGNLVDKIDGLLDKYGNHEGPLTSINPSG